ncbi:glycerol-3-phosphate 1-O-acyltransferase PlsY [Pokkaliibacter sp. CJK22405]|uniref:glycerol-3-phosphate 1-O-acyltransferase PlsY n=1 Tax=Pokkaliibacter sp. CJK22405 TaxID=3384615 RepID=UPI0039850C76
MSVDGFAILLVLLAYLAGSVNAAILVCRGFRLPDPRTTGSLNPGATNVLRLGGKLPAILTLIIDVAKGALPAWLGEIRGFSPLVLSLVVLAAVIGHLLPVFFNFRGGKGVATALGGWLVVSPITALMLVACWLVGLSLLHRSAGGALVAALAAPFLAWWQASEFILLACLLSLVLIIRHLPNLRAWRLS